MARVPKQSQHAAAVAVVPEHVSAGVEVLQESDAEERDWAQLLPELVAKIADDLLHIDVTEYIRVRAVCKPWRSSAADLSSFLEPRHFPRNWLLLAGRELQDDGEAERFVNVRTGAVLRIRLPTPSEYTHHGNAEGLLVLRHSLTDTVCLLNPLTMEFADLPSMAAVNDVMCLPSNAGAFVHTEHIKAVGIVVDADEDGRPPSKPTVVLSLTWKMHTAIVCGKPGDNVWSAVDMSCIENIESKLPVVKGGLSVRGRFYIPTCAGDLLTVVLRPRPHLAFVARQVGNKCSGLRESSYLVPSDEDNDDGLLLVRNNRAEEDLFVVFAVDVANRRLILKSLRGITVFLPSVTLRSSSFPSLLQDRVLSKEHMNMLVRGEYI